MLEHHPADVYMNSTFEKEAVIEKLKEKLPDLEGRLASAENLEMLRKFCGIYY